MTDSIAPGNWNVWSARPELAATCMCDGEFWTTAAGDGPSTHGGWEFFWHHVAPGRWYQADVAARPEDVPNVRDNLRAELVWYRKDGKRADWAHVRFEKLSEKGLVFASRAQAPPDAAYATLRVFLRWTNRGNAIWFDPRLGEVDAPKPRKFVAAIATGRFPGTNVEANLDFAVGLIEQSASAGADVVCLPECITSWRIKNPKNELARPIPGVETDRLASVARAHNIDVVCSMNELANGLIHNTGLYVDAKEGLVGKYRKVHLAVGERWHGVTPGDDFPVWQTRFGKAGMLICYDNVMPEGHRILSQKGAEMLFMPIMGDPRAVGEDAPEIWQRIMQVRATDSHAWFIVCRNNGEWGCIIRPDGEIVARLTESAGVATAEIDLDFRHDSWIGSDFRNRYWGERRPHLYGELHDDLT